MKHRIAGIEYIPVIVIALIVHRLVNNYELVKSGYRAVATVLNPFFWGFAFAYLINPLMVLLENRFKLNRVLSIVASYAIVGTIFTVTSKYIFPEITTSISDIIRNIPQYYDSLELWVNGLAARYPEFYIDQALLKPLPQNYQEYAKYGTTLLGSVFMGAIGIANQMFKLIIGLIISIYFLMDKEKFISGSKKVIYGTLSAAKADQLVNFGLEVHRMFSRFIIGKTIDSIIIGIICYFGMRILGAPYPVLFALIIGITNMIPFFGPFLGAIPVVLITLFINPLQAVWVGVFILVLQQFDGYILGPKILGDSVGLSPFWIILSIVIGGAVMGVFGMIVAVPTMAVIRNGVIHHLDKRIEAKGIEL